jgi:hypothetical protein
VHAPPVVCPPQPVLQLGDCGIERCVEVGGTRFSAYGRATPLSGDFDALAALGLATIGFVEQLHVVPDDFPVIALEAGQLFADECPIVLGHLYVAALNDDVHTRPPSLR